MIQAQPQGGRGLGGLLVVALGGLVMLGVAWVAFGPQLLVRPKAPPEPSLKKAGTSHTRKNITGWPHAEARSTPTNDEEWRSLVAELPTGDPDNLREVLKALGEDHSPKRWDFWASYEQRPEFSWFVVPYVVRAMAGIDLEKTKGYLAERVLKKSWRDEGLAAQAGEGDTVDLKVWPVLSVEQLETIARDPAQKDDSWRAWRALLRRAPKDKALALRDELLANSDPMLASEAVRAKLGPVPMAKLEVLMALEDPWGRDTVDAYLAQLDLGSAENPDPDTLLQLSRHSNQSLRSAGVAELIRWFDYSTTGADLVLKANEAQVTALLASADKSPSQLVESPTAVGLLVGQLHELRGQVEPARAAYQAALKAAAKAPKNEAGSDPSHAARAAYRLALLELAQGRGAEANAAAQVLSDLPETRVEDPFSADTHNSSSLLGQLLAGWLELHLTPGRDKKSVEVTVRNRSTLPHTLYLGKVEQPGKASAPALDDVVLWVGAKRVGESEGTKVANGTEHLLPPGKSVSFRIPVYLSHQRTPYRLNAQIRLTSDEPGLQLGGEAVAFVQ